MFTIFFFYFLGQLNECSHKLEKLQLELKKYQGYLEEATRNQNSTNSHSQNNSPRLLNGSRRNHRNSGGSGAEEESLSRSASDSSVTNPTHNHNKSDTPRLNHGWVRCFKKMQMYFCFCQLVYFFFDYQFFSCIKLLTTIRLQIRYQLIKIYLYQLNFFLF